MPVWIPRDGKRPGRLLQLPDNPQGPPAADEVEQGHDRAARSRSADRLARPGGWVVGLEPDAIRALAGLMLISAVGRVISTLTLDQFGAA